MIRAPSVSTDLLKHHSEALPQLGHSARSGSRPEGGRAGGNFRVNQGQASRACEQPASVEPPLGDCPTLSLVIVTYLRDAAVCEALRALEPHAGLFREILVVDNGNSPALVEFARHYAPGNLRILPQPSNDGAVGRTHGILASSSDIVVTLDDDVRLHDPSQLVALRHFFQTRSRIGCVNFRILYESDLSLDLSDWCHPRDPAIYSNRLFETSYISEGACALNGPLVRQIGAYPLDLFIGQEGVELAARILDSGHDIYYLPSVSVTHSVAPEGRTSGRQYFYNARNIYWIALRTYPLVLAVLTILREWSTLCLFSLIRGRLPYLLRGCLEGMRSTRQLWADRRPIAAATATHISRLNSFKPTIAIRLKRLLRSKTLE
jgi:GT2 family glycosyltransferase